MVLGLKILKAERRIFLIFLLVFLLTSACGNRSDSEVAISFTSTEDSCIIMTEEQYPIALKGTNIPPSATITWTATRGEIGADTGFTVIYTAPQQPGPVVISAVLEYENEQYSRTLTCQIIDGSPVSSNPPEPMATATYFPAEPLLTNEQYLDILYAYVIKSNIDFVTPEQIRIDETAGILLILKPFTLQQADEVEVTRIKVVLKSLDPDAFVISEMHENAEQVVGLSEKNTWHWSVTAKKADMQVLAVSLYRPVQYEGREFWQEIDTYKSNVYVPVTATKVIDSIDWK